MPTQPTLDKLIYVIPNSQPSLNVRSRFGKVGNLVNTPQRSQFTGSLTTGLTTLGMTAGAIAFPPVAGAAGITYISLNAIMGSAFVINSTVGRINPRKEENIPRFIDYDKQVKLMLRNGKTISFKVAELLQKAAREGSFNEDGIYTVYDSNRVKLQFELNQNAAIKLHLDPEVFDMLAPLKIQRNTDVADGATTAIEQIAIQSLERFTTLPYIHSHRQPELTTSEILSELATHNLEKRNDVDIKLVTGSNNEVIGIDVCFTGDTDQNFRLTKEGIEEIKMACEQEGVDHKYVEVPQQGEHSAPLYIRINPKQLESTISTTIDLNTRKSNSHITQLNDGARISSSQEVDRRRRAEDLAKIGGNGMAYKSLRR